MSCIKNHGGLRGALALAALGAVVGCSTPRPAPAPAPTQRAVPPSAGAGQAPVVTSNARNWDEYRVQAARRIVAANPQFSHTGRVQAPLLAIPVLEVELNVDGSVRNVSILREPSQAKETSRIAIDAVRRAGPFGDVSRLPRPWRFSEAFLFNDDKRFKPRSLD